MQRFVKSLLNNTDGAAVVEATILFPIIFMIFAALVLLSMYLPQRAILQRAVQYTATAMSIASSDEWLDYDGDGFSVPDKPDQVYVSLFKAFGEGDEKAVAKKSVKRLEEQFTLLRQLEDLEDRNYDYSGQFVEGGLKVNCEVTNYIIYKEIIVSATQSIPMPVDLTFVHFPRTLDITVSATAVVQNGEEFVRSIDIVVDIVKFLDEKFQISSSGIFENIKEVGSKISGFLGI